jgi:hypothetical protein
MKTILLFLIIGALTVTIAFGQNKNVDTMYLSPLTEALTDHTIGTAFSLILFQKTKANSIRVIQIISTNTRAKKVIDNLFYSLNLDLIFEKLNKGNYCYPIFIAAETNDEVPIWDNNSYENISLFSKDFKIPNYTILLKPYILLTSPPIR